MHVNNNEGNMTDYALAQIYTGTCMVYHNQFYITILTIESCQL